MLPKDYKSIVPSGHRRLTKQTGQNMLVTVSELINTNRHMYSNNNELRMKDGICQQTNSSRIVDYHPRMEHMKHLKPTKITRQFERFPPSHDCWPEGKQTSSKWMHLQDEASDRVIEGKSGKWFDFGSYSPTTTGILSNLRNGVFDQQTWLAK